MKRAPSCVHSSGYQRGLQKVGNFAPVARKIQKRYHSRALPFNGFNFDTRRESVATTFNTRGFQTDNMTTETPSPDTPLLLKGDEYCMSPDMISRTRYQIKFDGRFQGPFSVEECYDLNHARKIFYMKQNKPWNGAGDWEGPTTSLDDIVLPPGDVIDEVKLQEICDGVYGHAGTGATTWESSIVMALCCRAQPSILQGHVLELGCGLGLAGILLGSGCDTMESITLTDHVPEVLEHCQQNVAQNFKGNVPVYVEDLDWQDSGHLAKKFDTIIASDCSYRGTNIDALMRTMKVAVRDQGSRIHIFGPSNRVGLQDLLDRLRGDSDFDVAIEMIELEKTRLKDESVSQSAFRLCWKGPEDRTFGLKQTCGVSSSSLSIFFHITVKPHLGEPPMTMFVDID